MKNENNKRRFCTARPRRREQQERLKKEQHKAQKQTTSKGSKEIQTGTPNSGCHYERGEQIAGRRLQEDSEETSS